MDTRKFCEGCITISCTQNEFKFHRITQIPIIWKKNDYWIVDTLIEYSLDSLKIRTVTFQVDSEGRIIGYNLHEKITS